MYQRRRGSAPSLKPASRLSSATMVSRGNAVRTASMMMSCDSRSTTVTKSLRPFSSTSCSEMRLYDAMMMAAAWRAAACATCSSFSNFIRFLSLASSSLRPAHRAEFLFHHFEKNARRRRERIHSAVHDSDFALEAHAGERNHLERLAADLRGDHGTRQDGHAQSRLRQPLHRLRARDL